VGIIDKNLGCDSYGAFGCKWGAINKNGEEVIPIGKYKSVGCYGHPDFDRDNPGVAGTTSDNADRKFYEGMTSILPWGDDSDSPKYGFVDVHGNEIIPAMYTGVSRFRNGLSVVEVIDHEKTGPVHTMASVIDTTGATVIPFKYQRIDGFYDEITVARSWDPYTIFFIDKKGNQPFPCNYYYASPFHEGMAEVCVKIDGRFDFDYQLKHGFIDIHGQEIVPCKYDRIESYYDGIAKVGMGNAYWDMNGAVDKQGREFIPCLYNGVRRMGHGLVAVYINRRDEEGHLVEAKCGIFDKAGNEIVPTIYNGISAFYENKAAVKKGDKWGFIEIIDAEE
jgi:hypothetical protein